MTDRQYAYQELAEIAERIPGDKYPRIREEVIGMAGTMKLVEDIMGPLPPAPPEPKWEVPVWIKESLVDNLLLVSDIMGYDLPENVADLKKGLGVGDLAEGIKPEDATLAWGARQTSVLGPNLYKAFSEISNRRGLLEDSWKLHPVCSIAGNDEGASAIFLSTVAEDGQVRTISYVLEDLADFINFTRPNLDLLNALAKRGLTTRLEGEVE